MFAHAGVPVYGALWEYARDKPNVFVDLSSWTYVGKRERLGAVKALGVRRCLFGTDGPYLHSDFGQMVQAIQELPLPDRDKECILAGNFLELTGADLKIYSRQSTCPTICDLSLVVRLLNVSSP